MGLDFPTLLEKPDSGNSIAAVFYDIVAFFSLPFLFLFVLQGAFVLPGVRVAAELIYHGIHFSVAFFICREYLTDAFWSVKDQPRRMLRTASSYAAVILVFGLSLYVLFTDSQDSSFLIAYGTLPLAELELFTLSSLLVDSSPIPATVCMVFCLLVILLGAMGIL